MKYTKAEMDKKLKELQLIGAKVSEIRAENEALEKEADELQNKVQVFNTEKGESLAFFSDAIDK